MAVKDQIVTDRYALYCGDAIEVMATLPDACVHLSVYSPPFAGLFHYSSSERDLSNCRDYGQFFEHYGFVVRELARLTMPLFGSCSPVMSRNSVVLPLPLRPMIPQRCRWSTTRFRSWKRTLRPYCTEADEMFSRDKRGALSRKP